MALNPANFNVSISPNPIKVTVGMTGNVDLSFSNTSSTERGYNLSATLTLPDGVSYAGGLIPPTSTTNGSGGTIILTWTDIKDLAPDEVGYKLGVILKADENFRSTGLPVPFDIPLTSVVLKGAVDTLPRGNDDPGNVQIIKTVSTNFIPLRYNLTKSAPKKMPKGAGLLSPAADPRWPYQYTLIVENNSHISSTVTLIDNLPNGVRYLDVLSVTGPDSAALSSPTVIFPFGGLGGQDFVTINWGTVVLSPYSINTIVFTAAIWDNYTVNGIENSGTKISHLTPLQNIATLNGLSGSVNSIVTTNAMDITINKNVASSSTDVGKLNNYTLTYRVNQYDDVENVIVTDTISNGQTYNTGSASIVPVDPNPPRNPDGTTILTWDLGLLNKGTTGNITFNTTTSSNYFLGEPVSAGDGLSNNVTVAGTNQTTITPTLDNSSANIGIGLPDITKQIVNYFYKDGTPKTSSVVAPGDKVEFKITYNSIGLAAEQLGTEIDEYAPANMGPLNAALPVTYGGTLGTSFTPITVSPNGLRWILGTVPGNSLWTADFSVSVANVNFVGTRNNLAKLAGINTPGIGYSDRDQVQVTFGKPNITFRKTVTGPNVNAIKSGEIYTYSIKISNPQNSDGTVTDAFEMDLTDIIPTGLVYAGTYTVVTGTGTYTPPVFAGQNVSMTVNKLAPGDSLTLNYTVQVTNLVVSGQKYINNAILQRPYSQPDRSYQFPGTPFNSSTTLRTLGITMTKLISPVSAKIGDSVTYILQVTVPLGTTAYNVQVIDNFPSAEQNFILGSATKNGFPITPGVSGGTVTFDLIPFVNATAAAVIITYAFDVRVINGTHVSPFIENQTDNATVNWDLDGAGTHATPYNTSAVLQVRTPNLTGRKEQRNVTAGGIFTSNGVQYNVGDIIEYRITVTNNGAEAAYNSVVTDVLNPLLAYNVLTSITTGSVSVVGNTVTWNIPFVAAGDSDAIVFTVTTLPGVAASGTITDNASIVYNTNNNGFGISYGPINTNTVQLIAPPVTIIKTASISQGKIGDDITYIIKFTVPNGTIAYTPEVTDDLPVGQTYIGPATRQDDSGPIVTVTPVFSGQTFKFPINPDIDASAGNRVITYTFVARITSATHNPPYQEVQTNGTNVKWAITSGGTLVKTAMTSVDITVRTPNITILKEQRNVSTGGSYTQSDITGIPGDVIYYRLTINSNGASPAFNINLSDVLSSKITFVKTVSGPGAGTVTLPPPGPDGTLIWHIDQLDNGFTAVYEFQIAINAGIGAGDTISDTSSATYDSNNVNPITYSQNSNSVDINIPLISFDKTANTSTAAIGSTIQYALTVTIPNGVAVNNLSFTDVIPAGQNYVPGSFGGTPLPTGTLTAIPNQLIYTDSAASRVGPLTLIYTFNTLVIAGITTPPYIESQRNIADVQWNITPSGPTISVSDFKDITIKSPHITALKEQRLVYPTQGDFTTNPLLNIAADYIVEYRITITNDGAGDAYNVVTRDTLDSSLTYLNLTSVSVGVVIPPISGSGGTVTWTINPGAIISGQSETLVFQIRVNVGPAPGTAVFDQTSTLYDTFTTNATTLGPELSNQVAFNYNLPVVIKEVDRNAVLVGNTVNYTVAVTIPKGNIAYNVKVTDTLPTEQTYVSGTLKENGTLITPASTNPLITPSIAAIDATIGAVTVTYTFSATVNSISTPPEQGQVNTARVDWTLDSQGEHPGGPVNEDVIVYVTNSTINVQKFQSNTISGPFTTGTIQTTVGNTIYYKLSVRNPGPNTIYDVVVKDILNSLLQFTAVTVDVGSWVATLNTLDWVISSIPVATTYNAIVSVLVLPGGGSESKIQNYFTAFFDAVVPPPEVEYGPFTSNTVLAQLPPLQFNKTASNTNAELGEIITYTLQVVIPAGTIAYNVVVSDTLPVGQNYAGNAFIGGNPVSPTQAGQTITFPAQERINATAGKVTLVFIFDARIVEGNASAPFTSTQNDTATLSYSIDSQGTPAAPLSADLDITVNNPFLVVVKYHRNVTQGTGFRIVPLAVNVGDIVRYQLEAISFGASPAYNVILTDVLGLFDQFIDIVLVEAGKATYNPITRTITWIIDSIAPGDIYDMRFDVEVLPGVEAGGSTTNIASFIYGSNPNTPIEIGAIDTNEVIQNYPDIQITKSSNMNNVVVGKIITYTTTFTVPKGTLAHNIQLSDILPVGEQYDDTATLNGLPVTPASVDGKLVKFQAIPSLDATNGSIRYVYTFNAVVTSANVNPETFIDTQTNESDVSWFIDQETQANHMNATADVNVTNNSIKVVKLQRNVSQGGNFTGNNINGCAGQNIEYSMTVTNTGPNPVYNVIITDTLLSNLEFVSAVSVPIGKLIYRDESTKGVVTWSFSPLNIGEAVTSVFSVTIKTQPLAPINNSTLGDFAISSLDHDRFAALDSNDVILDPMQPIIQITVNSIATIVSKCHKPSSGKICNDKQK